MKITFWYLSVLGFKTAHPPPPPPPPFWWICPLFFLPLPNVALKTYLSVRMSALFTINFFHLKLISKNTLKKIYILWNYNKFYRNETKVYIVKHFFLSKSVNFSIFRYLIRTDTLILICLYYFKLLMFTQFKAKG